MISRQGGRSTRCDRTTIGFIVNKPPPSISVLSVESQLFSSFVVVVVVVVNILYKQHRAIKKCLSLFRWMYLIITWIISGTLMRKRISFEATNIEHHHYRTVSDQ